MGKTFGLISGSGEFPVSFLEEIDKLGDRCVIAAVEGEASPTLEEKAAAFSWFRYSQIRALVEFFQEHGVKEVYFVGKINPRQVLEPGKLDEDALNLLKGLKDWSPSSLIKTLIDYLSQRGISVENPHKILSSLFCPPGILTATRPSAQVTEDISFGWSITRSLSDLEIGQTLIVKNKTVVAVEGMEGTDNAILRGRTLAGPGTVVIKISRTVQDMRIDLPAVGMSTIRHLVKAKSKALCFEAERMPFFQKDAAVRLADENSICIVSKA